MENVFDRVCLSDEQLDWTTGMSFGKSLTLDASLIANVAQLETLDKNGKKQPTKMTEHTTENTTSLIIFCCVDSLSTIYLL